MSNIVWDANQTLEQNPSQPSLAASLLPGLTIIHSIVFVVMATALLSGMSIQPGYLLVTCLALIAVTTTATYHHSRRPEQL